ncbi:MAG: GNAT family N-acetyltransferase, partial [Clostridia bacterium]|nr:GNAT family N-acetyltransferase [Clostridia bacterium]
MHCRLARPTDAPRLVEIYAPYVRGTAITFATAPLTEEDFLHKMEDVFPFLVCEEDGQVLGYAYAAAFRAKEAYRWDVE